MASEEALATASPPTYCKYSKRVVLKSILERDDGGFGFIGQRVVVGGWVKSSKEVKKERSSPPRAPPAEEPGVTGHKNVSCTEILQSRIPFFRTIVRVLGGSNYPLREKLESVIQKLPQPSIAILQISDGSCVPSLQVVVDSSTAPPSLLLPTGTCVLAQGILMKPTVMGKQAIELKVEKLLHIGTVHQDKYPLSKKRLPLDTLRDCSHFRPRTTTVASVMRIRSALTLATHTFFQNSGFLHVQMPIITTTDCEGFSEKFQVTTLRGKAGKEEPNAIKQLDGVSLEVIKASMKEKTKLVEELQRTDSNKEALAAAVHDLRKTKELASQLESKEKTKSGASVKGDNKAILSEDFFSQAAYLTVSGRLHLESYACSLGNVYSFGPRFRADKIQSSKHMAEMYMAEVQIAFSQLEDAINCADDCFKFLCKWVLENCSEDMKFICKRIDKTTAERLELMMSSSFEKMTYTDVVDTLKKVTDKVFQTKIKWGDPLVAEHLSYLADEIHKKPVIIYNYPKELKPFYVSLNDDGKTVAAFDMIVPKVGMVITGGQNEERVNMLNARIKELGLQKEQYEWYLDLHRHGTVKQSGFSLRFDHMVLFATALTDVRDAIPFPRSYGKAYN